MSGLKRSFSTKLTGLQDGLQGGLSKLRSDSIGDDEKMKTIMSIKTKTLRRKPSFQLDPNAKATAQQVLASSGLDQLSDLSFTETPNNLDLKDQSSTFVDPLLEEFSSAPIEAPLPPTITVNLEESVATDMAVSSEPNETNIETSTRDTNTLTAPVEIRRKSISIKSFTDSIVTPPSVESEIGATPDSFLDKLSESLSSTSSQDSDNEIDTSNALPKTEQTRYDTKLIADYTNSLSFGGLDYEKDSCFVVIAKNLPSDKLANYEAVMDNLLQFYLENIESKSGEQFNIFFISGLAKVENLPKLKWIEKCLKQDFSTKSIKKFYYIHLGMKMNLYITRVMNSLRSDLKQKLVKCTKLKSLEKYNLSSDIPLPEDVLNFDKRVK